MYFRILHPSPKCTIVHSGLLRHLCLSHCFHFLFLFVCDGRATQTASRHVFSPSLLSDVVACFLKTVGWRIELRSDMCSPFGSGEPECPVDMFAEELLFDNQTQRYPNGLQAVCTTAKRDHHGTISRLRPNCDLRGYCLRQYIVPSLRAIRTSIPPSCVRRFSTMPLILLNGATNSYFITLLFKFIFNSSPVSCSAANASLMQARLLTTDEVGS